MNNKQAFVLPGDDESDEEATKQNKQAYDDYESNNYSDVEDQ